MQFTRPPRDRFIRIFDEGGKEIISINAATSSNVVYPSNTLGRTLTFSTDYYFHENRKFYILLEQGKRMRMKIYAYVHVHTHMQVTLFPGSPVLSMHARFSVCNVEKLGIEPRKE